jgi:hypothetical protein
MPLNLQVFIVIKSMINSPKYSFNNYLIISEIFILLIFTIIKDLPIFRYNKELFHQCQTLLILVNLTII